MIHRYYGVYKQENVHLCTASTIHIAAFVRFVD